MFSFLKNISPTEVILIVLILVVLFGGKFAIKLGRVGGESFREIKKIKDGLTGTTEKSESRKD
ncbi:MAG TPA: twin-arginine translocase TatA/TatE family subunit [Patescibacteria group bacterium]|nr:twin-arginine translocase TatA/TatE family subunit [Patescibacteria group bacterium]